MAQQKIPTEPTVRTVQYANLLGVDYQSDSTEVSRRHSPEMVNMISDLGGNPVKRYGYRTIGERYRDFAEIGDTVYAIRQAGPTMIFAEVSEDANGRLVQDNYATVPNIGNSGKLISYNGRMFILGWNSFVEVMDAFSSPNTIVTEAIGVMPTVGYSEVSPQPSLSADFDPSVDVAFELIMPDARYIPTVTTMLKPNGAEMISLPADTDISGATQGVNLLTPFRTVEYCVQKDTVAETTFNLPAGANRFISEVIKVEIRNGYGLWEEVSSSNYTLSGKKGDRCVAPDGTHHVGQKSVWFAHYLPTIKFNSAPFTLMSDNEHITNAIGTTSTNAVPVYEPNIRITYAVFNGNTSDVPAGGSGYPLYGYYSKGRLGVYQSKVSAFYDGRLFIASGSRVYYSRTGNPFMMDDDYYIELDAEIVALMPASSGLAMVGEGNKNVYLAVGGYNEAYNMPVYTVKATNATITLASSGSKSALNDEPMLLTTNGIYGLSTNYLSEKYAIMRSGKINRRLCAEDGYSSSVAIANNNYLYVAVGTHMYVLDGRHRDSSRNGDNSYECYFFDDMPTITDMWVVGGRLYFSDGINLYTWNDTLEDKLKYIDGVTWDSTNSEWTGGTPVKAMWKSTLDGDGIPHYYKTLQKKGTMVTVAPPMQTSCQITLIRDANDSIYVGRFNGGTFSLSDAVLDAFTKKKVKKYKRLQFVIENNEPEPFGIISVIKSFVANNYAKR